MTKTDVVCAKCQAVYKSSGSSGYCPACRKILDKNICEIITENGTHIFDDHEEVAEFMKTFEHNSATLRLDLHGVLDTIDENVELPVKNACAISYVGRITRTRAEAALAIAERIKNKQILFGVLVFKRGKNSEVFKEAGSKAWFNSLMNNSPDCLFVDDSYDHVVSVESVGVKSVQMFLQDRLIDLLKKNITV